MSSETYIDASNDSSLARVAKEVCELAHALAGSLAAVAIPGWETSEAAERWVEKLREANAFPYKRS
jgi:hypothetical protein